MTQTTRLMVMATGLVLAFGLQGASAQIAPQEARVLVSVNGGGQGQSQEVAVSSTFTKYGEEGSIDAAQTVKGGGLFDVSAAYRVWRNVAVGLGFTRVGSKANATVSAVVPHPLFIAEPRSVTGSASGLEHSEFATHIQIAYTLPVVPRFDVTVFGGPSIFSVKQDLVRDVTTEEVGPPYNQVTLSSVTTGRESKSTVGVHVGADATYMVTSRIGVGGFLRYAGASVDLPALGGGTISLDVGGVQGGAGVRVRF